MHDRPTITLALTGAALLFGGASASATAQAAKTGTTQVPPLSRAEVTQKLDADFKVVDTNGDGKVTKAEIDGALAKQASQIEGRLKQRAKEEFDKLDANHDGQLSLAEFQTAAALKPREGVADARIKQLDTNRDGVLTAAEFRSDSLAEFDKLDKNKDGTLSVQERMAARSTAASKK